MKEYKIQNGKKEIILKPNWLAEQANGNVLVQCGETIVLSTVVMSKNKKEDLDFLPLLVDYEEKSYAAGKILGSQYHKREGRPSENAITIARLIDRALRPIFSQDLFGREIQIVSTCLSWDAENSPDLLALTSASAALAISDIPFETPVGAVKIGRHNGQFLLNPTYEEIQKSDFIVVFAGLEDESGQVLINMIEGEFQEINEEIILEAFMIAKKEISKICQIQKEIIKEFGKAKISIITEPITSDFKKELKNYCGDKIKEAIQNPQTLEEIRKEIEKIINEKYPDSLQKKRELSVFLEEEIKRLIEEDIITRHQRPDGRTLNEIRTLLASVGILPRSHGSALFSRGKTRALSIVTLGAPGDQQLSKEMEATQEKRFFHHYNFPPYSVGEIKPMKGPSRRDIGHGLLVEKALRPVLPSFEDFPYTIRIVSEILSSNGSTSMASVCSSSLALMDAGVPIKRPVVGISIGIIKPANSDHYCLLTDIQGLEDHHGGMDLKIAGTSQGLTAIQMDVKIKGIKENIFAKSMKQAKEARLEILKKIEETLIAPRASLSPYAPRIIAFQIKSSKIGEVIGPGGKIINEIIDKTGVTVDIKNSGQIFITATKEEMAWKAAQWIKDIVREVEIGETYQGQVKKTVDFGAFVEILPGQEGLIHISKLASHHVNKVEDIIKEGDSVSVKVLSVDDRGRINLSLIPTQNKEG